MREIKFRVWEKKKKIMYPSFNIFHTQDDGFSALDGGFGQYESRRTKDIEVMRYTGFKDKNDKEVYEGDIISVGHGDERNKVFDIRFYEFAWELFTGLNEEFPLRSVEWLVTGVKRFDWGITIVGNIYENPELLKEIDNEK